MVSHGVDIDRLNTMVVLGLPLTTAEYIQTTARIGRRWPGLVFVLLALAFRRPREVSEMGWVYGLGVWFPLAVLSVTLAAALWAGERILPHGPAFEVKAEARQWGWRFTSMGPDGPVENEGVMHIPAGQPVDVLITSRDVIHSFWVPRLGGKMDAIPGRENRLRIIADRPGTYRGVCAEFCGLQHATMGFEVIAHEAGNGPSLPAGVQP